MNCLSASLLLSLLSFALLAENPCREFGLTPAAGPNGYVWRKDRCEGVFVQEVAGSSDLRLVSFASRLDLVNFSATSSLRLNWAVPAPAEVRLRGFSLRSRHYYRMDAARSAQAGTSYDWPIEVLKGESLKSDELGIVGWMRTAPFQEEVYLPIRVAGGSEYRLMLQPGAELSEVYISFARLGADGKVVQQLKKEEPLGRGYYPAGRGFPVALPKLGAAGFCRLEAAGVIKNGGSVTRAILLYLPAN